MRLKLCVLMAALSSAWLMPLPAAAHSKPAKVAAQPPMAPSAPNPLAEQVPSWAQQLRRQRDWQQQVKAHDVAAAAMPAPSVARLNQAEVPGPRPGSTSPDVDFGEQLRHRSQQLRRRDADQQRRQAQRQQDSRAEQRRLEQRHQDNHAEDVRQEQRRLENRQEQNRQEQRREENHRQDVRQEQDRLEQRRQENRRQEIRQEENRQEQRREEARRLERH
jgi:hypothetical protein